MKKHLLLLLALSALSALSVMPACRAKEDKAQAKEAVPPLPVDGVDVQTEKIERRVDLTATLAAWEEATVSVEVEGRISEINADLGDNVTRGAVLGRITPVEFVWRKAQTDADLAAAETDYKRLTDLGAKNLVAKQQVDEGRRRLEVAKAAADLAAKKFADTTLRAPFAGTIAKRLVNAGEYIRVGTPAFMIVNADPIKLKGDVPERFASDVKVGDEVQIFIAANPAVPVVGKIVRVGPSVALDSRSFPIEARVDNADGKLKAGSFARASIRTSTIDDALTIPERAVFTFAGNPRVFVVDGGKAHEQPIEIAGKSLDKVLVGKGLNAGQKVAASSVELLTDGRAVTVR